MAGPGTKDMREAGQRTLRLSSAYDVVVLGAGPAGLLFARDLAANGLSVIVVSPRVRRALAASYGLWRDEAEAGGIGDCLEAVWPRATVRISDERAHVLERPYARVAPARLLDKLRAQALAREVRFLEEAADELVHDDEGTTVRLEAGGELRTRLVVDATGHAARFIARERSAVHASQMSYGVYLDDAYLPWDDGSALLMDLRPALPDEDERQPSFLYALLRPDGHALVEETSLVGAPPVPERELERRLRARMARLGVRGREVGEEISCLPLGRPLPDLEQRVLGFGAAGGLVHPVTGNMLPAVLSQSRPLADELARAFDDGTLAPALAPRGWRALWTEERREAREIQVIGMEVLRLLDGEHLRGFFDTYFTTSGERWSSLLGFDADADETGAALERVVHAFPFGLKLRASRAIRRRGRRSSRAPRRA